ncbi:MAG TPA: tetratricopeptide repeat protein [Gemmataceae bacterium]|nr:tetratricopeptide repeat protein [Gemmataceae bacterium]
MLLLLCLSLSLILAANGWAQFQFRAAQKAFREGKYQEASDRLRACRRIWAGRAEVQLWSARTARWQYDFPNAEKYLQESRRLGAPTEDVQLEWLLLRAMRGEIDDLAPGLWKTVESGHPQSPQILETMAKVYQLRIQYAQALECLDAWVEREPRSARALEWRGWTHERLEHVDAAMSDYQKALDLAPEETSTRARLAALCVNNNKAAEALENFQILRRSDPARRDYQIGIARCQIALGESEEARRLLEQVLAEEPDNPDAIRAMAQLEQLAGQFREAETLCRKLVQRDPLDVGANYTLYLSLAGQGDRTKEAEEQLQRYERLRDLAVRMHFLVEHIDEYRNNADKLCEFGTMLLDAKYEDKGLFWIDRALKVNPQHRAAHEALAKYYETRDPAKAAEHGKFLEASK